MHELNDTMAVVKRVFFIKDKDHTVQHICKL